MCNLRSNFFRFEFPQSNLKKPVAGYFKHRIFNSIGLGLKNSWLKTLGVNLKFEMSYCNQKKKVSNKSSKKQT
jgi:hypothetical protein